MSRHYRQSSPIVEYICGKVFTISIMAICGLILANAIFPHLPILIYIGCIFGAIVGFSL